MTTLHVNVDKLERAVEPFGIVRSLSASADFPSGLRIKVRQDDPVALLSAGAGRRAPVSKDGTVLPKVRPESRLPLVKVGAVQASGLPDSAASRRLVAVLAAAPRKLRPFLARAYFAGRGSRVATRGGPVLYFGDGHRLGAKWAAAARVLADRTSRGASYIDVRLPDRPAAGGLAPLASAK
jgi:cell division protein FtsQ